MFGFGKSRRSKGDISANKLQGIQQASQTTEQQFGFDFAPVQLGHSNSAKQRWVQLGKQPVPYTLNRSNRKTIGFSVSAQGLSVTAPRWSLLIEIEAALRSKQTWILSKLAQVHANQNKASVQQRWAHGELLPYLGKHVILNVGSGVTRSRLQHGMFEAETLHLALNEDASDVQIKDAACAWLQEEAKRVFAERIPHFEAVLSVKVTQWRLSNASTRWGSASSNGHVRLHWRLMHFAPDVIDYVIAHELAHLKEMNHSDRFWSVVESAIPNYVQVRQTLKKHALHTLDTP